MSDHDKDSNSLMALVAGIIIGAGITYLFTTKEGRKLKDKLSIEGNKVLDKLQEGLETAQDEIEEHKEEVQEAVSEIPKQVEQIQKKGRRFFFRKHSSES